MDLRESLTSTPLTKISSIRTLDLQQAAALLRAHRETIRRLAASGQLPAVKVGRRWVFIEQDLAEYLRAKYASSVTSQGAVCQRSTTQWRFTNEVQHGGLISPIKDKEYNEVLGLPTK